MLMLKSFLILDMSSPFSLVLASFCQISNILWVLADFLEQLILYFFSLSTVINLSSREPWYFSVENDI